MGGRLIPDRLDLVAPLVHVVHRVAVVIVGGYLIYVVVSMRRAWDARLQSRLLSAVLVLYLVQVVVGASAVWFQLDPWTVVAHVAVAALVWSAAVLLAILGSPEASKEREPRRAATPTAP